MISSCFDTNTIILLIAVISATLSALVVWIAKREDDRKGLYSWSGALVLHCIVFCLFALHGKITDSFSILISNAVLAVVYSILLAIVSLLKNGEKLNLLSLAIPPLLVLCTFPFVIDDINLRIVFGGIIFSIQNVLILHALMRKGLIISVQGKYLLGLGCSIILAVHVVRILFVFFSPGVISDILSQSPLQSLTFIATLLSTIIITNGIIFLAASKRNQSYINLALRDRLTGINNRLCLEMRGGGEIHKTQLGAYSSALVMIDIDDFKKVNDDYGHLTGDQVLTEMVTLISGCINPTDIFGRWGGEEFIIIFPGIDLIHALMQAEYVRSSIDTHFFAQTQHVTASFGVAISDKSDCWESWLERADRALYRAKRSGKNKVDYELVEVDDKIFIRNFMKLSWLPIYNTGFEHIDKQHRLLFESANLLLERMISSDSDSDEGLYALVNAIINDIIIHFKDEEKIMKELGYSGYHEHTLLHEELVGKAKNLIKEGSGSRLNSGELFQYLVYEVIAWHILVEDRKFAVWVLDNN